MKNFKQAVITVITLTITFVIPVTVTAVIRNNPTDIRSKAQEITAQAANTVNTGFTQLSNTSAVNLPLVGEVTLVALGLFLASIFFLVLTIVAGINLLRPKKAVIE